MPERNMLPKQESTNQLSPEQQAAKQGLISCLKKNINDALKIIENKEKFNLSDEIIKSSEVQEAVKQEIIYWFNKENTGNGNALKIIKKFNLSDDIFKSKEAQEAVKRGIIYWFQEENIDKTLEIIENKEKLNLLNDIFKSKEAQEAAKRGIIYCLGSKHRYYSHNDELKFYNYALKIIEKLKLEDKTIQDAVKNVLFYYTDHKSIHNVFKIIDNKDKFKLTDEIITSDKFRDAIEEKLIDCIKHGNISDAVEIIDNKDKFKLTDEIITSDKFRDAIEKKLIDCIKHGNISDAVEIIDNKDKFKLTDEIITSDKFRDVTKKIIIYIFNDKYTDYIKKAEIIEVIDLLKLTDAVIKSNEIQDILKQELIHRFKYADFRDFNEIIKIRDIFKLTNETIQDAAKQGIIYCVEKGDIFDAQKIIKIIEHIKLKDGIIESNEVQNAIRQLLNNNIRTGSMYNIVKIIDCIQLSDEIIQDSIKQGLLYHLENKNILREIYEILDNKKKFNLTGKVIQDVAKQGLIISLENKEYDWFNNIIDEIKPSNEVIQDAIKQVLIYNIENGNIEYTFWIINKYKVKNEIIQSEEVQQAAKQGLISCLEKGNIDNAFKVIDKFNLSDETIQQAAKQGLISCLKKGNINNALKIIENKEKFNLSDEIIQSEEAQEAAKQGLIKSDKYYPNQETYQFFGDKKEELKEKCEKYNLYLKEYFTCEDAIESPEFQNLDKEQQSKRIFELLQEKCSWWKDKENISNPFNQGSQAFGYDKMFKYIGENNRHDTLLAFNHIINLSQKSDLRPQIFYENILSQVSKDSSLYGEDNPVPSYQYLNQIAQAIDLDKNMEVLNNTKKYPDIDKLQNLVKELGNKENICQNWNYLKKYYEITQLLGKSELLDKLKNIKIENPALYNYAETLMFHPGIDMNKVIMFIENPNDFFELSDEHSAELHELKKPSNYFDIPYLDLIPSELRDSLVKGTLDKIQAFNPLEIDYQITKDTDLPTSSMTETIDTIESTPTQELLKWIFQDKKKQAELSFGDLKELRKELQELFKLHNIGLRDYFNSNTTLSQSLSEEQVRQIIFNEKNGIKKENKTNIQNYQFRAKLNLKSDPDAVVAGNDTACCMPFGSGKNNVYTFNPICTLFTLQEKRGDKWRTVAQSVMTIDMDIKKNTAQLIEELEKLEEKPNLDSVISEEILSQSKHFLTADNVEVAENFKQRKNANQIIESIYRDFFTEYLKRFNQDDKFDNTLIIGPGYSDSLTHLDKVNNTYLPLAPVGYSDNVSDQSLQLKLGEGQKDIILNKLIKEIDKPKINNELVNSNLGKGISYLDFRDCLKIAYIESKAYQDNPSLMAYLHNLENGLIAKDINNTAKNRPNLSLKYTNEQGKTQGYLFTYEGEEENESIIYITDLAAHPEAKMAGGRLINSFINLYKQYYIDKNNLIPIVARARDKTSYQIILRQLNRLGQKVGVQFNLEEENEEYSGEEIMHNIKLVPKRI